MRWLHLLAFVVITPTAFVGQAGFPKINPDGTNRLSCRQNNEAIVVGGYQVRLVDTVDQDNDDACDAYLVDRAGKQMLLLEDWDVAVHQGTGEDLFGDGTVALILEGYSGGAHCCYTYKIIRLGETPLLLSPIENETAFYFLRDPASGQFRIFTWDGAFDYFDGMCHACTPFPRVILQIDATGLRNVSSQFVEQFDAEIAELRRKGPEDNPDKVLPEDLEDYKRAALDIVLSYLYSGREKEAWQTLEKFWPAKDKERMKRLIIETKSQGLLSKLAQTAPSSKSISPSLR